MNGRRETDLLPDVKASAQTQMEVGALTAFLAHGATRTTGWDATCGGTERGVSLPRAPKGPGAGRRSSHREFPCWGTVGFPRCDHIQLGEGL